MINQALMKIDRTAYRLAFDWHDKRLQALASVKRENIEQFWEDTCESMCAISRDNGGDTFLNALLIAAFEQIERVEKEMFL